MPTIISQTTESAIWKDPLFDLHVNEFNETASELDIPGADRYSLSEQLCEASRAILYRLPRLTSEQATTLIDVFDAAITKIRSTDRPTDGRDEFVAAFAAHIEKRINMLRAQVSHAAGH